MLQDDLVHNLSIFGDKVLQKLNIHIFCRFGVVGVDVLTLAVGGMGKEIVVERSV